MKSQKSWNTPFHGQVPDVSGIKDAEKTDGEKMMNCEQSQESMIDVLYGEEVTPRQGFEFFQHLSECPGCNREYMELVETREVLGEWKVGHQNAKERETRQAVLASRPWLGQLRWWPLLQKIAAGFLIVVGVVSILQYMGYLGGKRL